MESESFEADSLDHGTFDGSSPQDLTDAIGQLHGLECAVRRRMLNLIVAYDRREDWKADGATSMVDWASTQLRLPRTQAVQLLEVAAGRHAGGDGELEHGRRLGPGPGNGRRAR